jgi:hypothetical protein
MCNKTNKRVIMNSDFWDNVCLLQDPNQSLQCSNRVKKTWKNLRMDGQPVGNEICYYLHTCWPLTTIHVTSKINSDANVKNREKECGSKIININYFPLFICANICEYVARRYLIHTTDDRRRRYVLPTHKLSSVSQATGWQDWRSCV